DLPQTWRALVNGRDAAIPVSLFDVSASRGKQAGQVQLPELGVQCCRRLTRGTRLALPAAREALAMAGLLDAAGHCVHAGLPISVSTTGGGMALGEQFLRSLINSQRAPRYWFVS